MTREEAKNLLDKYEKGLCTADEVRAINAWLDKIVDDNEFFMSDDEKAVFYKAVRKGIGQQTGISMKGVSENKHKGLIVLIRRTWWAAAVLLALLILFISYIGRRAPSKTTILATSEQPERDVQPGTTSATLTLSNGKKVVLNDARVAHVNITKGKVCLVRANGTKAYLDSERQSTVYNILTTKKGEQAPPLTLADGTKVWLNAASTLRFSLSFQGKERQVFLSGEAYFEVAKDSRYPFVVNAGKNKVEVLGTHFDVMAYQNEPYTYATLMAGAIRIQNDRGSVVLTPGQQGRISSGGDIDVKMVDTDQTVAWMNGKLSMDNMDIKGFLRAVSRWYNVDVVYKGEPHAQNLSGSLNKEVPLSQVLSALNAYGIHCKMQNQQIVVFN